MEAKYVSTSALLSGWWIVVLVFVGTTPCSAQFLNLEYGLRANASYATVFRAPPGIETEVGAPQHKNTYRLSVSFPIGRECEQYLTLGIEHFALFQTTRILNDRDNPQRAIPNFEDGIITHRRVSLGGTFGYERFLTDIGRARLFGTVDFFAFRQSMAYTGAFDEDTIYPAEVSDYRSALTSSLKPVNYRGRVGLRLTFLRFFVTYRYDLLRPATDHSTIANRDVTYGALNRHRSHLWTLGYSHPLSSRPRADGRRSLDDK
jgi:hypothetical protein